MSLVVARKEGNKIYIVSDTKLTFPNEEYPNKKLASPKDGVIKTVIVNPHICISIAGEIEGVSELVRACRRLNMDYLAMVNLLLEQNKISKSKSEFILCFSFFQIQRLYEIKDEKKVECEACWIGSQPGFSEFQKYIDEERRKPLCKELDYCMEQAMQRVIQSGIVEEVNGFLISVSNSNGLFQYKSFVTAYFPDRVYGSDSKWSIGNNRFIIAYGSAEEGGYNVYIFPPARNSNVLAIHILQGKIGIIYSIRDGGLLWPEIFTNIDERQFAELTNSKYGISPLGFTS